MRFELTHLSAEERGLQADVRSFLAEELPPGSYEPGAGAAALPDQEFSKKLAMRGWVGMALPARYGGGDRSPVERFIVAEELLRWGAPIAYHWIADRQSGPLIARFGTNAQREELLPRICRAETSFCIGMSEPEAGSDLAAVRTRATRVDGGWSLSGTKIWTSGAHYHELMIALVRTSDEDNRHGGLTQMIVDLSRHGVRVSPIRFIDGSVDFNEVVLEDVFVPDTWVIGTVGEAWQQIGSELESERSGPDRWISTYYLVEALLRESQGLSDEACTRLGEYAAHWAVLRNLSLSVARAVQSGKPLGAEAALVKEYGNRFEQDVAEGVLEMMCTEVSPQSSSLFERLLANAVMTAPSFTIRGGTVEVLRSIAAKGLKP
jgi:alkylation response protein AidB-like acyl-CoA dehydrogenase